MRQIPTQKRSRGRGNGRKHPQSSRTQSFDSNGPSGRIRGNASQVYEKYQALARDAQTSGDRIMAENFFQHAEHYYRIMSAAAESQQARFTERRQPRADQAPPNGSDSNEQPAEQSDEADPSPAEAEPTTV